MCYVVRPIGRTVCKRIGIVVVFSVLQGWGVRPIGGNFLRHARRALNRARSTG